jgi:hypothetical protein
MNFVLGDLSGRMSFRILDIKSPTIRTSIALSKNSFDVKNTVPDKNMHLVLEDPYLRASVVGNDTIWSLITVSENGLKKNLLNSIEWLGKGLYERDPQKTFLQFLIGIEAVLQFEKDAIVSPSIVSSISEALAFITEDDLNSRKVVSNRFKRIYRPRSLISHGKSVLITAEDLTWLFNVARKMIICFLTKDPIKNFSSTGELGNYLTDLKFG